MTLFYFLRQFMRGLFSRVSLFLIAVHWLLFMIAILFRGSWGAPIHFFYEPALLKLLLLIDFPSIAFAEALGLYISNSGDALTFLEIATLIGFPTIQWMIVGSMISALLRRRNSEEL